MNIFEKPLESYTRDLNTLKDYVEQSALFLSKNNNVPIEEAKEFVIAGIRGKSDSFKFTPPKCTYLKRDENGNKQLVESNIYNFLSESIKDNEIISPSLTTYVDPNINESLYAKFIDSKVASRDTVKQKQFVAKSEKRVDDEKMHKIEQNAIKQSNNSLSGAQALSSSGLSNTSAHPSLTSTCRTTTANAGAHIEKFIAGSRHYYNLQCVLNNITSIILKSDYILIKEAIDKFNLHIPTAEQIASVIKKSTKHYWFNKNSDLIILNYLNKLTDLERVAFMYTNDFWNIKNFNEPFIRNVFDNVVKKITDVTYENPVATIKTFDSTVINMACQICSKETADTNKNWSKISLADLNIVAATAMNINNVIISLEGIIKAFFITNNLPAGVARMPQKVRKVLFAGDTDSTMYTAQFWVKWYTGEFSFNETAIAVGGFISLLVDNTITHVLATMSKNIGIQTKRLKQIQMKNEFRFNVFIPTQMGKHYFADVAVQEGAVFSHPELEIKGVYMKDSSLPESINETAEKMMDEIINDYKINNEISVKKYMSWIYDIETNIKKSIQAGDTEYLRTASVKAAETYKNSPDKSPYRSHLFYVNTFGTKYGTIAAPPYATVKISTILENSIELSKWIRNMKDKELAATIQKWIEENGRTEIPVISLPMEALRDGLHPEIAEIVNYEKIIGNICKIFYIIMESIGIYMYDAVKSLKSTKDYFNDVELPNESV